MKLEGFGTTANPVDSLFAPKAKAVERGAFEGLLDQQQQAPQAPRKADAATADRPATVEHDVDTPVEAIDPNEHDIADDQPHRAADDDDTPTAEVGPAEARTDRVDSSADDDADAAEGEPKSRVEASGSDDADAGQAADAQAEPHADGAKNAEVIAELDQQERPAIAEQPTATPAEQVVADLRTLTAIAEQPTGEASPTADAARPTSKTPAPAAPHAVATESADDAQVVIARGSDDQAKGQQDDRPDSQHQHQQRQPQPTHAPKAESSAGATTPAPSAFGAAVVESPSAGAAAGQADASADAEAAVQTGSSGAPSAPTPGDAQATSKADPAGAAPVTPTLHPATTAPSAQPAAATAGDLPEADAQRLTERVVQGLRSVVNQRGGSLTMRLTPANLGSMRISVRVDGTTVSAQLQVSTNAAGQALRTNLAALRHSLESQGLTVEQLNVHVQPSSHSGGAQANAHNNDESPADGQSRGRSDSQTGGRGDGRENPDPDRDFQRELLDLVA